MAHIDRLSAQEAADYIGCHRESLTRTWMY